jgi:hypothetical protein
MKPVVGFFKLLFKDWFLSSDWNKLFLTGPTVGLSSPIHLRTVTDPAYETWYFDVQIENDV